MILSCWHFRVCSFFILYFLFFSMNMEIFNMAIAIDQVTNKGPSLVGLRWGKN